MKNCPCGSNKSYESCCGSYITTDKPAPTPEALMRSRYAAYSQANIQYIVQTMKEPAATGFDPLAAEQWAKQVIWQSLNVLSASQTGDKGFVEFIVHYQDNHQSHVMHEISEFHFENGRWYYVDGVTPTPTAKQGRNELCACGSNKKFKKCCGK